ncbi:uncharacterized protein BJ212DRAFT_1305357 [Suillus subaureus]|uniref:Uncharacterized protein n=1 Tax=Suillus subaureus TaxID=48587 RepID=A0A9P7DPT9_9AGAM|nr:uncharacterized protein BJ212DRAFT_1305357 [Suillus subaureus]KAG1800101.1 hypothetical protein BJ212DRAFT_1305357 [Suillus subaureus]
MTLPHKHKFNKYYHQLVEEKFAWIVAEQTTKDNEPDTSYTNFNQEPVRNTHKHTTGDNPQKLWILERNFPLSGWFLTPMVFIVLHLIFATGSTFEYYQALSHLTDNTGTKRPKVKSSCASHNVVNLADSKRVHGLAVTGITSSNPQQWEISRRERIVINISYDIQDYHFPHA